MTAYIGIDPGISGAFAVLWEDHAEVYDAPTIEVLVGRHKRNGIDHRGALELLDRVAAGAVAALEQVTPNPQFGAIGNHVLGRSFATWESMLVALEVPYELVRPTDWKAGVGLPKKATKGDAVKLARQRWPQLADRLLISKDGRAEALLIADWRRRQDG